MTVNLVNAHHGDLIDVLSYYFYSLLFTRTKCARKYVIWWYVSAQYEKN